jgi:hypothetical protein
MRRPVLAAEIVSRTGYNLPVGQADAGTRRISGVHRHYRGGGHALTNTRPALPPQSLATVL